MILSVYGRSNLHNVSYTKRVLGREKIWKVLQSSKDIRKHSNVVVLVEVEVGYIHSNVSSEQ